jgi:hypothetical protein
MQPKQLCASGRLVGSNALTVDAGGIGGAVGIE